MSAAQLRSPLVPPLACDNTLAPLVLFLFVSGWLFFSSLVAGVNTTRVVARVAREGCRDASLFGISAASKRMPRARRGAALPAGLTTALRWVDAFSQISSAAGSKTRRLGQRIGSRLAPRRPQPADAVDSDPSLAPRWGPTRRALVTYAVPYRWLSNLWGKLTRVPLPGYALKWAVFMAWTKLYNCQLHEMRFPLEAYNSLSEFFLRPLKDGARRVHRGEAGALASPVDGKVMHVGRHCAASADGSSDADCEAAELLLEQVKGVTYRFSEFVGAAPAGLRRRPGTVLHTLVAYLAPGDYHHFHSPADWSIEQRRHFPGNLLPVRPWAVRELPGLYCANERVALNGSWAHGYFGFVAVGALNVGSIDLAFEPELSTNQQSGWPFACPPEACLERSFAEAPVQAVSGQRLGDFNLGSTVVLVFEAPADFDFCVRPGDVLRMGQRIGGPASA